MARDATGQTTQAHFGIMAIPSAGFIAPGIVGAIALALTIMLIRRGGALGWTFGILLALVAIAGIGFFAFAIWGRYSGMPWDFAAFAQ